MKCEHSHALARLYARSSQGSAISQQTLLPGQNITLISAISLKSFLGGMTLDGGINGVAFQVFQTQSFTSSTLGWSLCRDG